MKLNNNDDSHNSGLNLLIYNMLLDIGSHPAWVCGLKPSSGIKVPGTFRHTLRGCVDWNPSFLLTTRQNCVTPCVGVWIETGIYIGVPDPRGSHPAWVCGLKHKNNTRIAIYIQVTPCVGVWIETSALKYRTLAIWSHPAWVCGLKLAIR